MGSGYSKLIGLLVALDSSMTSDVNLFYKYLRNVAKEQGCEKEVGIESERMRVKEVKRSKR